VAWRLTEVNATAHHLSCGRLFKIPTIQISFYIIKENLEMYRVHSFA